MPEVTSEMAGALAMPVAALLWIFWILRGKGTKNRALEQFDREAESFRRIRPILSIDRIENTPARPTRLFVGASGLEKSTKPVLKDGTDTIASDPLGAALSKHAGRRRHKAASLNR